MRIKPFKAWRAEPGRESLIASPPYDVVDRASALAIASRNPMSFLHISRADINLPEGTDSRDPQVYAASAEAFRRFKAEGWFRQEPSPALYAYRLASPDHEQVGLVTVVHTDDYLEGIIRRHEFTRPDPEEDRTRHILALNAQAGPLLLAFRGETRVETMLSSATETPPIFDFTAPDGIRHTGWSLPDPDAMTQAFSAIPSAYIADGHHRAAGAARVARERRSALSPSTATTEADWMMAVLFPSHQLRILAYNRCVRDLGSFTPATLVKRIEKDFVVKIDGAPKPSEPGWLSLFVGGRWFRLTPRNPPSPADPVASLDVSVLQDQLLSPILGIHDPRRNERLSFHGGSDDVRALARRVESGEAAAAFALPPVSIEQLISVSDAGLTLPPKSTWFEPKLRSGLFVHSLEDE